MTTSEEAQFCATRCFSHANPTSEKASGLPITNPKLATFLNAGMRARCALSMFVGRPELQKLGWQRWGIAGADGRKANAEGQSQNRE